MILYFELVSWFIFLFAVLVSIDSLLKTKSAYWRYFVFRKVTCVGLLGMGNNKEMFFKTTESNELLFKIYVLYITQQM